jgi:organic hydroperoxide reductase OsmC/OhrA
MHPFPHRYQVNGSATPDGSVTLGASGLPGLESNSPPEFDGPPGYWSPETLLTAAVADCFVLSFRAVARASKFEWKSLAVDVTGTLERPAGAAASFTGFETHAKLVVAPGTDAGRAKTLLEKAEKICLITASLKGANHLHAEVVEG